MDTTVRAMLRYAIQSVALAVAFVGAFVIRFDGAIPQDRLAQMVVVLPVVVIAQSIALNVAGVGRHSWRYTTLQDLVEIVIALAVVGVVLVVARLGLGGGTELPWGVFGLPYGVVAADWVLSVLALAGLRAVRRLQSEGSEARDAEARSGGKPMKRVLLIGAGRAGVLTARELVRRPDQGMVPVAFLDDDPGKRGRRVAGLDVLGSVADVGRVARDVDVDLAIITIAALQRRDLERIIEYCNRADVGTKIVPGLYEIVGGDVSISRIRDVDMSDLLGRPVVELDDRPTIALVVDRCVMITGAGGSIGAELVRQVAALRPAHLVLVDQSEPALWTIDREVETSHPGLRRTAVIADVCDEARLRRVYDKLRPDLVVHAAAHKHVPMMEDNPGEAIKNNVGGTRNVLDLAVEFGVGRFVMVSTDKAVNPTSIMGATKRLAERYVQHVAETTGFHAASVRFGNVLGSTGSVVPIFREQVAAGGPVTVTHPEMQRYFMTIPEASQLILQAAAISAPGEILVLDMGEPVRILDLAESVIRLSGMEPEVDIPIVFTGMRPGEKLFEELALNEEQATRTRHPKIWIGSVPNSEWVTADRDLDELLGIADAVSAAEVRARVRSLVPEFMDGDQSVVVTEEVNEMVGGPNRRRAAIRVVEDDEADRLGGVPTSGHDPLDPPGRPGRDGGRDAGHDAAPSLEVVEPDARRPRASGQ
jgi:FlaA1/EpsC-like NDP-sugar epimerase